MTGNLKNSLKIIVIEPFYGGSHQQFVDGFTKYSKHKVDLLSSSAHHWKWHMRASPLVFLEPLLAADVDILFCSSFVDVAALRGVLAAAGRNIPMVLYMHENQVTYPVQSQKDRNFHFAFTQIIAAHAADAVWWNSEFNKKSFYEGAAALLARMPDGKRAPWLKTTEKSQVKYMGLDFGVAPRLQRSGRFKILWNQRWEFDKNPQAMVQALCALKEQGHDFEAAILGQRFKEIPPELEEAVTILEDSLIHVGFVDSREEYLRVLGSCDVVLSTALHEFFGISVVEAAHHGCVPILPNRLSYPEVFAGKEGVIFYENEGELARILASGCSDPEAFRKRYQSPAMAEFAWTARIDDFDRGFEQILAKV